MDKPAILANPEAWAVVPAKPDELPYHLTADFCDDPECTRGCAEAQEEIREFRRKQALKPERQRFAEVVAYVEELKARAEAAEARVRELEARLAEARNQALEDAAKVADARDVLAAISSFLGAGLGDESTTASDYDKRIRWGIDDLQRNIVRLCVDKVEQSSKRPSTTWGEVKASVASVTPSTPDGHKKMGMDIAASIRALKEVKE